MPGSGFQARPTLKAVDGVSLAIRRGETLVLVGETGSGKTTFGRLLLGLYRPTSGDIRYRGTSILDRKSQAARDVPAAFRARSGGVRAPGGAVLRSAPPAQKTAQPRGFMLHPGARQALGFRLQGAIHADWWIGPVAAGMVTDY